MRSTKIEFSLKTKMMAGFVTFSMNNIKRQTKYFKVMLNNLDGGHKIQYEIEIVVNEVKVNIVIFI